MEFDLDGPRRGPASGGKADALIVLLHGLGADGNDLIELAPVIARFLPSAAFVSPHAPFPCDMAPFGRQWFSLQDYSEPAMLSGAGMAHSILSGFLDGELERLDVPPQRLALLGFSQGCMMALFTGLRRKVAPAAILGYSGHLIAPQVLAEEIACRPPVLLVHGDADEVVPAAALPAAADALRTLKVPLEAVTRPGLGHGIDSEGLELGVMLLRKTLGSESL